MIILKHTKAIGDIIVLNMENEEKAILKVFQSGISSKCPGYIKFIDKKPILETVFGNYNLSDEELQKLKKFYSGND